MATAPAMPTAMPAMSPLERDEGDEVAAPALAVEVLVGLKETGIKPAVCSAVPKTCGGATSVVSRTMPVGEGVGVTFITACWSMPSMR